MLSSLFKEDLFMKAILKKLLAIVLALTLPVSLLPLSAGAASGLTYHGCCGAENSGENIVWNYHSDKTLSLAGEGAMLDWTPGAAPWYPLHSFFTEIEFDLGITHIGSNAFYGCDAVSSVKIPFSVVSIGSGAFADCGALTEIVFEGDAPVLSEDVFSGITATVRYPAWSDSWAEEVRQNYGGTVTWEPVESDPAVAVSGKINNSTLYWKLTADAVLTVYGEGSIPDGSHGGHTSPWYYHRRAVRSVVIGDGVTQIGRCAFQNHISLESITFGSSLSSIGEEAFSGCTVLEEVAFPTSLTVVGIKAFYGCTSLEKLTLSDSPTVFRQSGFEGCTALEKADLGSCAVSIGGSTFKGCTALSLISMPDTVSTIGFGAFEGCTSLTELALPASVNSIGQTAFSGCSALEHITFPETLTTIGAEAFLNCTALTEVNIPASVTTIGDHAFRGCTSLTGFSVAEDNANFCSDDSGVLFNKKMTRLIKAPSSLSGVYTIPMGVLNLAFNAFSDCPALTEAVFPSSLTSIGSQCFANCDALLRVAIPNSVQLIYDEAFYDCDTLAEASLPSSLNAINDELFCGCDSLAAVTIPNSVSRIGAGAFRDCSSLTKADLGTGVRRIGQQAFSCCESLTDILFPKSLQVLEDYAFRDCDSLTAVNIPAALTDIHIRAFYGCSSLTHFTVDEGNSQYSGSDQGLLLNKAGTRLVTAPGGLSGTFTIPDFITSLGGFSFADCDRLTTIVLGDKVTAVPYSAFEGCDSLTGVVFGSAITTIDHRAFYSCDSLTHIRLPDTLTLLGYNAFTGCTALEEVIFGESCVSTQPEAFSGCSSLSALYITGDIPSLASDSCRDVTATVYYPAGSEFPPNYIDSAGGDLTWIPFEGADIRPILTEEHRMSVTFLCAPDTTQSFTAFLALYDRDGRFMRIEMVTVSKDPADRHLLSATLSIPLSTEEYAQIGRISAYLTDGTTMSPLCVDRPIYQHSAPTPLH